MPLSKRNLDIRVRVACLTWASRNYKSQSLNPLSRVLINLTPLSGAVSLNHWRSTVGAALFRGLEQNLKVFVKDASSLALKWTKIASLWASIG